MATRPHQLLSLDLTGLPALTFDVTILRAAKTGTRIDVARMMKRSKGKDLGIGTLIGILQGIREGG